MNFRKVLAVRDKNFRLADLDPANTFGVKETDAVATAKANTEKLAKLQNKLYAEHEKAVLVILQGIDAAGKDGTVKHVMSGVNPEGCNVTSFKQPDQKEKDHDFLWRIHAAVPGRGIIGIFNRSHYEDVIVVRVHKLVAEAVWEERYQQIRDFERLLTSSGTQIVKFFLHISKDEQGRRLDARKQDPNKNWKYSEGDLEERKLWDRYQVAFEDALVRCSRKHAPWYAIPADHKWFRDLAVSQILVETLEDLNLKYPVKQITAPSAPGK